MLYPRSRRRFLVSRRLAGVCPSPVSRCEPLRATRDGRNTARLHADEHARRLRRGNAPDVGVLRAQRLSASTCHVINETLKSGVAAFLRHEDYQYYCGFNWPKKARRDSKYAILFRACLAQVIDALDHIPLAREPHLRVVLEDGHKNAGDVVRVYNWAKSRAIAPHVLAGLTFDNKRTCLPLASADLYAYSAWSKEVGQKPIGIAKKRTKSEASYRGNLWRIMLTRRNLRDLHEQAIQSVADLKSPR